MTEWLAKQSASRFTVRDSLVYGEVSLTYVFKTSVNIVKYNATVV